MSSDRLTEILNFLSAISRDIGAFRTETNARLDKIEARLDRLEARVGRIETRLDGFEADLRALRADVSALTIRFDRDHAVVFDTRADVRELEARVGALEGKQT
jgi:BMFP domain-containing protein YqiC